MTEAVKKLIEELREHVRYKYMPAASRLAMEQAADALEALSPSPQGEGYDGSKSLGERLYEAHRTNWPKEWPVLSVWIDLPWSEHARWERVALSFVSRLSDGGEGEGSSREPSTDTCAAPLASEQAGQERGGTEP